LALLQTRGHLVIRFDQYRRYPTRLWELTRKHNPRTFVAAWWDFLHAREADLDVGFSLCLQREAWEGRSDADACGWLQGEEVQALLCGIFENAAAHSLEIERKHAAIKVAETTKVTGCATASRTAILQRYLVWRRQRVTMVKKKNKEKQTVETLDHQGAGDSQEPGLVDAGTGPIAAASAAFALAAPADRAPGRRGFAAGVHRLEQSGFG
jgi:hypothetical protein